MLEASGVLDGSHSAFTSFTTFVEVRMGSTVLHTESIDYEDFVPITTPFAFSIPLAPGDYQLTAIASGGGGIPNVFTTGTFTLDFSVVEVVPEPSTALFVALGAAGLAGMRRRARLAAAEPVEPKRYSTSTRSRPSKAGV